MRRNRKGVTLVELLVIGAIIAVLAALLIPAIQAAINASKTQVSQGYVQPPAQIGNPGYEWQYGHMEAFNHFQMRIDRLEAKLDEITKRLPPR